MTNLTTDDEKLKMPVPRIVEILDEMLKSNQMVRRIVKETFLRKESKWDNERNFPTQVLFRGKTKSTDDDLYKRFVEKLNDGSTYEPTRKAEVAAYPCIVYDHTESNDSPVPDEKYRLYIPKQVIDFIHFYLDCALEDEQFMSNGYTLDDLLQRFQHVYMEFKEEMGMIDGRTVLSTRFGIEDIRNAEESAHESYEMHLEGLLMGYHNRIWVKRSLNYDTTNEIMVRLSRLLASWYDALKRFLNRFNDQMEVFRAEEIHLRSYSELESHQEKELAFVDEARHELIALYQECLAHHYMDGFTPETEQNFEEQELLLRPSTYPIMKMLLKAVDDFKTVAKGPFGPTSLSIQLEVEQYLADTKPFADAQGGSNAVIVTDDVIHFDDIMIGTPKKRTANGTYFVVSEGILFYEYAGE